MPVYCKSVEVIASYLCKILMLEYNKKKEIYFMTFMVKIVRLG